MKALFCLGPGAKAIEERPKPELQSPGDAIVQITRTTICGTDLHILKAMWPLARPAVSSGTRGWT